MKVLSGVKEIYKAETKCKAQTRDLHCDLGLESAWLSHGFCTPRTEMNIYQNLMKIFRRVQEIWSGHESVTGRWADGWMDRRTN